MPSDFPLEGAWIVSLFLASLLHGIFLVTLGFCLKTLLLTDDPINGGLRKKRSGDVHWYLVFTAVLLFIVAALDIAMNLVNNLEAFVYSHGRAPIAVLTDISSWNIVTHSFCVVAQTAIGDAVLVYRLWVVWKHNWLIAIFPAILWLGQVGCSMTMIGFQAQISGQAIITAGPLQPLIKAFWCLTLTLNVFTTSLIVFRIWRVDQSTERFRRTRFSVAHAMTDRSHGGTQAAFTKLPVLQHEKPPPSILQRVIKVTVESGLIYSAMAIITFVTYIVNDNSNYTNSSAVIQVVGIAFNLIIVRSSNIQKREGTSNMHNSNTSTASRSGRSAMGAPVAV